MNRVMTSLLSFWSIMLLLATWMLVNEYPTEIRGQRWYSSADKAISYWLKDEGLTKDDVRGEIKVGKDKFIITLRENRVTSVSELVYESGEYTVLSSQDFQIRQALNNQPQWIIPYESYHGNHFEISTGYTKEGKDAVERANGFPDVHVDETTGIFYTIRQVVEPS
ncbi:hypothetical protein [Bacillus sp. J33]|uniref:hypothetical protein n=1 Tax=Bacillus sp. J33 TaxID=935836 RepID=UPI00047A642E|nr:hypothetical protein [Bacillus sp. J33]